LLNQPINHSDCYIQIHISQHWSAMNIKYHSASYQAGCVVVFVGF